MKTTYETPRQLELRTRSAAGAVIQVHARMRDPQPRPVASIKRAKPTWSPVEAAPGEKREAKPLVPQLLKWVAMAAAAAAPWVLLLSGSL